MIRVMGAVAQFQKSASDGAKNGLVWRVTCAVRIAANDEVILVTADKFAPVPAASFPRVPWPKNCEACLSLMIYAVVFTPGFPNQKSGLVRDVAARMRTGLYDVVGSDSTVVSTIIANSVLPCRAMITATVSLGRVSRKAERCEICYIGPYIVNLTSFLQTSYRYLGVIK
jgi:hypothetical protein